VKKLTILRLFLGTGRFFAVFSGIGAAGRGADVSTALMEK
jgi:hypothetical protein